MTPRARTRTRLTAELLEDRTVPTTFTVTNLNASGGGSLGDAIGKASSGLFDAITIDFAVAGGVINLTTFINQPASTTDVPQPAGPSAFIIDRPVTILGNGQTIERSPGTA